MTRERSSAHPAGRWLIVGYAAVAYVAFLAVFGYFVLFAVPALVPHHVDRAVLGLDAPLGWLGALLVNLGLMALFGVQHSVMARQGFKAWLTRRLPAAAERATYVLASSLVLGILVAAWQPLPQVLWSVTGAAAVPIYLLNALAWTLAVAATFMINHFDLLGLEQAWRNLTGRMAPPSHFTTRFAYRFVRHPLQAGIFFGLWIVPEMSLGHLLLSLGLSTYIVIGTRMEETDLEREFGEQYRAYRRAVPMLVPLRRGPPSCT